LRLRAANRLDVCRGLCGCERLPHPSPRNQAWFKHHPWFDAEVVPELRRRVAPLVAG